MRSEKQCFIEEEMECQNCGKRCSYEHLRLFGFLSKCDVCHLL